LKDNEIVAGCTHALDTGFDMNSIKEKRKFPRYEFQEAVRLIPFHSTPSGQFLEIYEFVLDAWTNDISEGGLRLESAPEFGPNTLLKMIFKFGNFQKVEAHGRIVWCFDNHAGVRFIMKEPALADRIKELRDKHGSDLST
jgi:hypothetical protein